MKGQKQLFSSKSDEWTTPKDLYNALNEDHAFTFDPCPINYTVDALTIDWHGSVFVNPPYSRIKEFIAKGVAEIQQNHCEKIVWLLPARTDTRWFHAHLYLKKNVELIFIKGRLKFGGGQNSAPFPSMIAIMRRSE